VAQVASDTTPSLFLFWAVACAEQHEKNERVPRVGFEPSISVFERAVEVRTSRTRLRCQGGHAALVKAGRGCLQKAVRLAWHIAALYSVMAEGSAYETGKCSQSVPRHALKLAV
jgi:hypothetical protein